MNILLKVENFPCGTEPGTCKITMIGTDRTGERFPIAGFEVNREALAAAVRDTYSNGNASTLHHLLDAKA